MAIWLGVNVALALLFFGCWAGIPMWHTLHRWNDEINAKHAELAAKAALVPVPARPAVPMAVHEAASQDYAGAAGRSR